MVTKAELTEALNAQSEDIKSEIKRELEIRISEVQKNISEEISSEVKIVRSKVEVLEKKVTELEKNLEINHQYQRQNNVLISGIPNHVEHSVLESVVINLFNTVFYHKISGRDIESVHRVSRDSSKTLVKFLNRKDASSLLEAKSVIASMDKGLLENGFSERIQVDVHLTPYMSTLAYKCRCLKREGKVLKVSTDKGRVKLLKSDPNGILKWHDVSHPSDLVDLFAAEAI